MVLGRSGPIYMRNQEHNLISAAAASQGGGPGPGECGLRPPGSFSNWPVELHLS